MENEDPYNRVPDKVYKTIELCLNRKAGPYGSVELIISGEHWNHSQFYYWPLGIGKTLSASQIQDLIHVVGTEVSQSVYVKVNAQAEIPGLLGS